MLNSAQIIGRLGSDAELRYSPGGNPVCNFSIATDESYKDKDGNKVDKAEWHRIVTFGKLAEICGKYLKKGKLVYIGGKLETDSYDKDGVKTYSTKIIARDMKMLDSKGESAPQSEAPPIDEDDIPFN